MNKLFFSIIFFLIFSGVASADVLENIKYLIEQKDYLGARVYAQKNMTIKMKESEWRNISELLEQTPQIGFDMVFIWNQFGQNKTNPASVETSINKQISTGDAQFEKAKWQLAYDSYSAAAEKMMNLSKKEIKNKNRQVYQYVLHQMARSLYALGNYKQATEVYLWIKLDYHLFKQVQVEKMWSAYLAGRFDVAIGSGVTLTSNFFGTFIDPEVFLLQVYMLKRLCRDEEASQLIKQAERLAKLIKENKINFRQLIQGDLYKKSLSGVLISSSKLSEKSLALVTAKERATAKAAIIAKIKAELEQQKNLYKKSVDKILGYILLFKTGSKLGLENVDKRQATKDLSKLGLEFWTMTGREEWLDELGKHLFVGESKCQK